MSSLEQQLNKQVLDELVKENYRQAMRGYLANVYSSCINTCYQQPSGKLSNNEKKCLLRCYKQQSVSMDSYVNQLVQGLADIY